MLTLLTCSFSAEKLAKKTLLHLEIQDAEMESVDPSFKNERQNKYLFFMVNKWKINLPWPENQKALCPQGMAAALLRELCSICNQGWVHFSVSEFDFLRVNVLSGSGLKKPKWYLLFRYLIVPRGKFKILIASLLSSAPIYPSVVHNRRLRLWQQYKYQIYYLLLTTLFELYSTEMCCFHLPHLLLLLKIYIRWKCGSPRGWKSHYRASQRQKSSDLEPTGSSQRSFIFTGGFV